MRATGPKYAPGYDLFKLIVAVLLTILLIFLLLLNRQPSPAPAIVTSIPSTATEAVVELPPTFTVTVSPATDTLEPPVPSLSPETATSAPFTATETIVVLPTITNTPPATLVVPTATTASSPTPIPPTATVAPPPTATPTASPIIPTPTAIIFSDSKACPAASSRVHIGDSLQVLTRLNFRTGPSLNASIIKTNNPGTKMEVIGGPICTRLSMTAGSKAYLWWQVRIPNGQEGWSAEAALINPYYFLEPTN